MLSRIAAQSLHRRNNSARICAHCYEFQRWNVGMIYCAALFAAQPHPLAIDRRQSHLERPPQLGVLRVGARQA